MSTEIAVRETAAIAERDIVDGWIAIASDVIKVANHICETDFVPKEYRGNPPAVAAAILTGRELGIGPMMSLRHVQIVRGVPTLSAEYKRARVLAAGHDFEVEELTITRCRVRGRRAGTSKWLETSFTMDDARRAKVVKADGSWVTRPRRMLFARAGSELCDFLFADVTNGLPTAELVADGADGDEFAGYDESPAQPSPAAPAQPAQRTARRGRATPQTASPAAGPTPPAPAGEVPLPPLPGEEPDPTPPASAAASPPATDSSTAPGADSRSEPDGALATTGQVGMMQGHFKRLGFEDEDREQRLATAATIAGLPEGVVLGSLKLLTQEQAKAVIDTLSRCKDRERLIAVLAAGEQDG